MCKDLGSQQKSPSQFNRLFPVAILGVWKTETLDPLWIHNFIAHMRRRHHLCQRSSVSPANQGWGKSLKSRNTVSIWEQQQQTAPGWGHHWGKDDFLDCAFCISDIASDLQYPGYKNIPLRRNMGVRTKREISFNSTHTHTQRKFKIKESKACYFIEPITSMSQLMLCYLGRHKSLALPFSWTWGFFAKCKSLYLKRGICPQNLGPCKSSCYLTGMQTYHPTISSMSHPF